MLDPRIPRKIAHLAGQPPRLKIDKLVVSSCNGSEINRRDGLTRAWNHFRVPFCPNGRTGRTRIEIVSLFTGILSKLGFGRGQKFFHVFLPFPLLFPTNTFGSLLGSLFGWITIEKWNETNIFSENFDRFLIENRKTSSVKKL